MNHRERYVAGEALIRAAKKIHPDIGSSRELMDISPPGKGGIFGQVHSNVWRGKNPYADPNPKRKKKKVPPGQKWT